MVQSIQYAKPVLDERRCGGVHIETKNIAAAFLKETETILHIIHITDSDAGNRFDLTSTSCPGPLT